MVLLDYLEDHPKEKIALVDGDRQITYGELLEQSEKEIHSSCHLLPSSPIDFAIDYLAAHRCGAVALPRGPAPPFPLECADLLYTSGSSGEPKGVMHTHSSILCATRQINQVVGNGPDDRELLCLPLAHSFGLGRLRCNLLAGATTIFVDGLKRPGEFFRQAEQWEVTGMALVPAMVVLLMPFAPKLSNLRLRYLELGSSPMRSDHKLRLLDLLPNCRICYHWGLTEAPRSAFAILGKAPLDSIGRPTPGVEVEVRGGELFVRGGHTMAGYLGEPPLDGWLATGDLGAIDDEGYLYWKGRRDDLLDVGGRLVAPCEIERALESHPSIEKARCLPPLTAQLSGERIADVELVAHLRERLESWKIPTHFEWTAR